MMAKTSLDAYYSLEPKKVETMKMKVYDMISKAAYPSNKDLSRLMGVEINRITPRVNELVKEGLVIEGGVKTDPFTKKQCKWWKVAEEAE